MIVCSMFRDAEAYLPRYWDQITRLRGEMDVRLVLAEGDSRDSTYERLLGWVTGDDVLLKVDHGGPRFGSVDHPQRWQQIATVARAIIEKTDGPVLWVEADLVWEPTALVHLVEDLASVESVSPRVMMGPRFYDTWGFRKDGNHFQPNPPYYDGPTEGLVKIDSCGSCFATTNTDALHAWDGMWPYTAGGGLWLDTDLVVTHEG